MSGLKFTLEEDRKTFTVQFPSDPPVAIKLSVADVDEFLKNLGDVRAEMEPEYPKDYVMGQKVEAAVDPIWRCEPDLLMGNTILHLRDPRYGWLHYMLPPESAKPLSDVIAEQIKNPPNLSKQ